MTISDRELEDIREHLRYINDKINADHALLMNFILGSTYKTNALHKRNAISILLNDRGYKYFRSVGVDDVFIRSTDIDRLEKNFNFDYGYDIRTILPHSTSNLNV